MRRKSPFVIAGSRYSRKASRISAGSYQAVGRGAKLRFECDGYRGPW
jgi:hypothetical protein